MLKHGRVPERWLVGLKRSQIVSEIELHPDDGRTHAAAFPVSIEEANIMHYEYDVFPVMPFAQDNTHFRNVLVGLCVIDILITIDSHRP